MCRLDSAQHNALQEVDGETRMNPGPNQAGIISEKLNRNHVYLPTDNKGLHAFGLAVISRFKIAAAHYERLPRLYPILNLRPRGALHAILETPAGKDPTSSIPT